MSRRARYVVWCLEVGSWRGDADGLVGAQPCWGAGGYRNPGLWAEDDEGNVLLCDLEKDLSFFIFKVGMML